MSMIFKVFKFLIQHDDDDADWISIDCGSNEDYMDETTGIWYQTDDKFTESGTNYDISPDVNFDKAYKGRQLGTLRSFPEGNRNCYSLRPNQENKNNANYLIRAVFAYGNYDNKRQVPAFDLYLGVNLWSKIVFPNASWYKYYEIIQ